MSVFDNEFKKRKKYKQKREKVEKKPYRERTDVVMYLGKKLTELLDDKKKA